ncbi:ATP-dependent helicase HrpB [Paenibacillus physcomitrellae]|uniref:ATP-dependent helicase HrpB n=1 Tax=Paenibacillus physcomitrellae TaxID=1619311 RepID=A0ABQ1G8D7_9BACL|nr:ATP-dependent helicase HrpB [Paenibacillus physcomitrellae]GGA38751.1 ATP-dependent helicase HrpB [Paenibacillus physcomitrellae]
MRLPVDECLPELALVLEKGENAVLIAEPGAGKTTRTPLALLKEAWLDGQGILMLEPRRLAARSAAAYMARELGEQVGETVGYRIRMESRTGPQTRITVVTEGILTLMLHNDPALIGTGLIIFDEFHERNLHSDLGLALTRQSQQLLREDLRILVMSATLKEGPVSALLGGAPVIRSQGRIYPVETRYLTERNETPLEVLVQRTVLGALQEHAGNMLVFLPGIREIRRAEQKLAAVDLAGAQVVPLYGAMTQEQQQEAIKALPDRQRKIVLATSIAESSLTVEGITVVIDSGLRRTELFSPRTGMGRLTTVRAARDSADQRRGRAGRTAPGVCYRLWTEEDHRQLKEETPPEMLEADLAPLALALAVWGSPPSELDWLTPPPAGGYAGAVQLLQALGALDEDGRLTGAGREMAGLGLHPRLGRMLLEARRLGHGRLACLLAALLEDSRQLRLGGNDADVRRALAALLAAERGAEGPGAGLTAPGGPAAAAELQPLLRQSRRWAKQLGAGPEPLPQVPEAEAVCGLLLSFAFPDRIGQLRPGGRYLLSGGRGAALPAASPLAGSPYLVAAEVDDEGTEGRIVWAAPLEADHMETYWRPQMKESKRVVWDEATESVRAWRTVMLGAVVYQETPDPKPSREDVLQALLGTIAGGGIGLLPWNAKSRQLQARIQFLARYAPSGDWPDVSDESLQRQAAEWIGPYAAGFRRKADLQKLNLVQMLESLLTWEQKRQLDQEAPALIQVPSGSRIAVVYEGPQAPYISVKLQEMFGQLDTPRLAFGRVPLTLHLLSPAARPVQVTSDLRSFWEHTYFEVKKDLKGRYPKHYWPDDPFAAEATRRVRPGGK